jgi:hypothetical protein
MLKIIGVKKKSTTFYCFSPPIMVATCIIELILFAYTVIRYKMTVLTRLTAVTLALLAMFQLCEFHVCRSGWIAGTWSRIGFMAITMLPPVGIHIIRNISSRGWRPLVWIAYASGAIFAGVFGFNKAAFESHICAGNYAIFQLEPRLGGLYFGYYYAWLFIGIGMSLYFSINARLRLRESLILQAIGFLIFVLPTGIVNDLSPKTMSGIPSIMCGFAVLYALILVFAIMPRVIEDRKIHNQI